MHWFLIALIGPLLYAISNHLDKLVLSRYIPEESDNMWVLTTFSAFFGGVGALVIVVCFPHVLGIGIIPAIELAITGMLVVASMLLYYAALRHDEASYVVPFYQTIPLFAFVLGYLLLGESITLEQATGGLVIIAGALILSFERGGRSFRFKYPVVMPMLGASFFYALNGVLFKLFALEAGFWESAFWGYAGGVLVGVAFVLCSQRIRKDFSRFVFSSDARGLIAASLSESFYVIAEAVMHYATLLAPVVLVVLVNAFQPAFVLIMGVILTLFFPRFGKESLTAGALLQKGGALALLVIGTYLIGV
jgi:drug/metabolite transporter (DMT)-like permease